METTEITIKLSAAELSNKGATHKIVWDAYHKEQNKIKVGDWVKDTYDGGKWVGLCTHEGEYNTDDYAKVSLKLTYYLDKEFEE